MAAIGSLLNPISDRKEWSDTPRNHKSSPNMAEDLASPRKKVKLTKDAPVFTPGPVRGQCRFPPDELQDDELAAYHQQFEISPFGEIADYPRHIPYNSEKKSFLEKTAREYLEVFQYTFKIPMDDHVYTMLWDYNIGLVRTTPLFKCTGHSKTTPAKMLNRNPGLRDICHSITGGALVAQGYWIPHAAAKAIAATFCYDIRHALTPVFGHDFPRMCIKPDGEGFGNMTIDPEITRFCAEQAKSFREEEASINPRSTPTPYSSETNSLTPRRTKAASAKKLRKLEQKYTSPYNSPYVSDVGSDDGYTTASSTPGPIYRNVFTPINTPRPVPRSVPYPERRLPSPRDILSRSNPNYRLNPDSPMTPPPSILPMSSPEVSPKTIPASMTTKIPDSCLGSPMSTLKDKTRDLNWLESRVLCEDEDAAYVLLALKLGKAPDKVAQGLGITLPCFDKSGRRSASA